MGNSQGLGSRPGVDSLSPGVDDDGSAFVSQPAAFTDPVDADQITLIFDRASAGEDVPVLLARVRPVGNDDQCIRLGRDLAKKLRKPEVEAYKKCERYAADRDDAGLIASGIDGRLL